MTFHRAVKRYKRMLILKAIDAEGGNCLRAAERLGVHRNTISRELVRIGLNAAKAKLVIRGIA